MVLKLTPPLVRPYMDLHIIALGLAYLSGIAAPTTQVWQLLAYRIQLTDAVQIPRRVEN